MMRPPSVFRLLAALLTFIAALASPAMSLAHGAAHGHGISANQTRDDKHAVAALAGDRASAPTFVVADGEWEAHRSLHASTVAKLGSVPSAVAAFVSLDALSTVCASEKVNTTPSDDDQRPLGRAASPDRPRAPPIG